jgi:hypothetical protein
VIKAVSTSTIAPASPSDVSKIIAANTNGNDIDITVNETLFDGDDSVNINLNVNLKVVFGGSNNSTTAGIDSNSSVSMTTTADEFSHTSIVMPTIDSSNTTSNSSYEYTTAFLPTSVETYAIESTIISETHSSAITTSSPSEPSLVPSTTVHLQTFATKIVSDLYIPSYDNLTIF